LGCFRVDEPQLHILPVANTLAPSTEGSDPARMSCSQDALRSLGSFVCSFASVSAISRDSTSSPAHDALTPPDRVCTFPVDQTEDSPGTMYSQAVSRPIGPGQPGRNHLATGPARSAVRARASRNAWSTPSSRVSLGARRLTRGRARPGSGPPGSDGDPKRRPSEEWTPPRVEDGKRR
jgi:hypothetical protein